MANSDTTQRRALPTGFLEMLRHLLGADEAARLAECLATTPPSLSVRLNPRKSVRPAFLDGSERRVPWCDAGLYLTERPSFTLEPLLHAGAFYVQEAASMVLSHIWHVLYATEQEMPRRCLDLCAAPGGKSTLLASLLPDDALLVCNEPVRQRAAALRENLTRWGRPNCIVTSADARRFAALPEIFDFILADVPCSGEGMMRKEPVSVSQWSEKLVQDCAALGRELVSAAWQALKPGGVLVYSTCTFNTCENEANVDFFCRTLGASVLEIPLPEGWGISRLADWSSADAVQREGPCMRFFPHRTQSEGLTLAVLRKPVGANDYLPPKVMSSELLGYQVIPFGSKRPPRSSKSEIREISGWLADSANQSVQTFDGGATFWCLSPEHTALLDALLRLMPVPMPGLQVAETAGRKLLPAHALALSHLLRTDAFPRIDVSRETALAYLRRETLTLPPDTPRGQVIITYRSLPLGWANHLGTRANNRLPSHLRIHL